jgi:hypothetical protein
MGGTSKWIRWFLLHWLCTNREGFVPGDVGIRAASQKLPMVASYCEVLRGSLLGCCSTCFLSVLLGASTTQLQLPARDEFFKRLQGLVSQASGSHMTRGVQYCTLMYKYKYCTLIMYTCNIVH